MQQVQFPDRKLEVMKTFQRLQRDLGLGMAMEAFQKVLSAVETDMHHDAIGCPNCWVCGDCVMNTISYLKNNSSMPRNL